MNHHAFLIKKSFNPFLGSGLLGGGIGAGTAAYGDTTPEAEKERNRDTVYSGLGRGALYGYLLGGGGGILSALGAHTVEAILNLIRKKRGGYIMGKDLSNLIIGLGTGAGGATGGYLGGRRALKDLEERAKEKSLSPVKSAADEAAEKEENKISIKRILLNAGLVPAGFHLGYHGGGAAGSILGDLAASLSGNNPAAWARKVAPIGKLTGLGVGSIGGSYLAERLSRKKKNDKPTS